MNNKYYKLIAFILLFVYNFINIVYENIYYYPERALKSDIWTIPYLFEVPIFNLFFLFITLIFYIRGGIDWGALAISIIIILVSFRGLMFECLYFLKLDISQQDTSTFLRVLLFAYIIIAVKHLIKKQ